MGKPKDLTGQRFGRLTVVRQIGKNKQGNYMWFCQCDCGNTCTVVGSNFSRKNRPTKSCGCLAKELNSKRMSQQNLQNWQKEDYKNKMSEQAKHQWDDEEFKQMMSETMRERFKGENNPMYGIHRYGEENPNYNPNLTDEDRIAREFQNGYKEWKNEVKRLAHYTCDCCGSDESGLHSHHLDSYNWCKERRLDLTNGVCLCEDCHKEFHHIYGYGDNTKEQYEEFKMNKQNTDTKAEEIA